MDAACRAVRCGAFTCITNTHYSAKGLGRLGRGGGEWMVNGKGEFLDLVVMIDGLTWECKKEGKRL